MHLVVKILIMTLRMMIGSKVRFLKNLAFVCVGVALGAKDVVWFVIALAAAIVLDALLTLVSLPDPPVVHQQTRSISQSEKKDPPLD